MEAGSQRNTLLSILHGDSAIEGDLSSAMQVFGSGI